MKTRNNSALPCSSTAREVGSTGLHVFPSLYGSYLGEVFGLPPQPSSEEVQSRAILPPLLPQPSLTADEQTGVLLLLQVAQNTSVMVPRTSPFCKLNLSTVLGWFTGKGLQPLAKRAILNLIYLYSVKFTKFVLLVGHKNNGYLLKSLLWTKC